MGPQYSDSPINSSLPRQNGRQFADVIFKYISMNEKFCILIKFSLIDNKAALVQVMAWRWTGDKSLPKPMLIQFLDAYMQH